MPQQYDLFAPDVEAMTAWFDTWLQRRARVARGRKLSATDDGGRVSAGTRKVYVTMWHNYLDRVEWEDTPAGKTFLLSLSHNMGIRYERVLGLAASALDEHGVRWAPPVLPQRHEIKSEPDVLTPTQWGELAERFAQAWVPPRVNNPVVLMAGGGLKPGEIGTARYDSASGLVEIARHAAVPGRSCPVYLPWRNLYLGDVGAAPHPATVWRWVRKLLTEVGYVDTHIHGGQVLRNTHLAWRAQSLDTPLQIAVNLGYEKVASLAPILWAARRAGWAIPQAVIEEVGPPTGLSA